MVNREAERKRLVELLQTAPLADITLGEYFNKPYIENCIVPHLLDNGIVVPPVKVGQTVYIITQVSKTIGETKVIGIWHGEYEYSIITRIGTIHRNAIGETVFTSREDAVKALEHKERSGE